MKQQSCVANSCQLSRSSTSKVCNRKHNFSYKKIFFCDHHAKHLQLTKYIYERATTCQLAFILYSATQNITLVTLQSTGIYFIVYIYNTRQFIYCIAFIFTTSQYFYKKHGFPKEGGGLVRMHGFLTGNCRNSAFFMFV